MATTLYYDINTSKWINGSTYKSLTYQDLPRIAYEQEKEFIVIVGAVTGNADALVFTVVDLTAAPYNISAISAAIDDDFDSGSDPACRTNDPLNYDLSLAHLGQITVTMDSDTSTFLDIVNGKAQKEGYFEIRIFDSGALCTLVVRPAGSSMILDGLVDPGTGTPGEPVSDYYTKSQTDARYLVKGDTVLAVAQELTISGGAVTRTQWVHTIDTEGDAAADDVDTISGATEVNPLLLYLEDPTRIVTIKHGTGNIVTSTGTDIVMAPNTFYELYYNGTSWIINDFVISGGSFTAVDSTFRIVDNLDATKKLAFECSGITTGTTRTLTAPDADDTLALVAEPQTLIEKTLTSPILTTPSMTAPTITAGKVTLPAAAEIEAATSLDLDAPFVGIDGATQSDAEKLKVSGDALVDGDALVSGDVITAGDMFADGAVFSAATELTIDAGSITVEQALHSVDTESDAATDDLDTIVATNYPGLLLVRANNAARTVVLKDGTGNLELGGADIELDAIDKFVILQWDTAETKWLIAGGSALGVSDYIDFTTGLANPAYLEGRRFYDNIQKCMASYNDKPDFTHQEGREVTTRVKNMTGVPIANGQVVYISGPNAAAVPLVSLAKADSPSTANAIGIATTAIAHTEEGEVTIAGSVNDLDLSLYSENDIVWLSAANAGDFTDTAPGTPDIQVQLGTVSFAEDSTGSLLMDIRYFGVESDFAEVSIDDNTVATTINTVNVWEQVTTFTTDGLAQGAIPDYTNGHITANKTAAYDVSAFFSFSGSNNAKYEVALYKNNGAARLNTIIGRRQMNSTGDVGMGPIGGKVDLTAGDTVELWVRNITGDQDTTFEFCVMGITEIGNICGAAPLGNLDVDGLTMSTPLELTIDAGSVTPTRGLHRVDTEGDVSADDLDTIVATEYSGLLMVRSEHTSRKVILKDGTGNLELGGSDLTLDDTNRFALLQYDPSQSKWLIAGGGGSSVADTGALSCHKNGNQTGLGTTPAIITTWTEIYDRDSEFNNTSGVFTAGRSRKVSTSISIQFDNASSSGVVEVYKNSTIMGYAATGDSIAFPSITLSADFEVVATDTIEWRAGCGSGTIDVLGTAARTQISVKDLS